MEGIALSLSLKVYFLLSLSQHKERKRNKSGFFYVQQPTIIFKREREKLRVLMFVCVTEEPRSLYLSNLFVVFFFSLSLFI